MIKKTVKKYKLGKNSVKSDYKYWQDKSPEERVSAVEVLRRQHNGSSARFQRVARIIKRAKG